MTLHPGGCLCGTVRFEARGPADYVVHCHCASCRRQTGAAVATFAGFRLDETFRWQDGEPSTFRSSPAVRRRFCRRCGTPISFEADDRPGRIYIGIGTFDAPDRLLPQAHHHWEEKLSWLDIRDGLPRHEGMGGPIEPSRRSPERGP